MRKKLVVFMMMCMAFSILTGCGSKEEKELETVGTIEMEPIEPIEPTKEEAVEENAEIENMEGMPNPIAESDEKEVEKIIGVALHAPEGTSNVHYTIISGEIGEMQFTLDEEYYHLDFTARVKKTDALEDISGCYYEWTVEDEALIGSCQGKCYRYIGEEGYVDVCNWYDEENKVTYSLSVQAADLDGFDITAIAMQL